MTKKVWQQVSTPDAKMRNDMKSWLVYQQKVKFQNAQDDYRYHSSICTDQVVDFLRQRPPIPTTKFQFGDDQKNEAKSRGKKSMVFSLEKVTITEGTY